MSQHDYNLANQPGATFRADLNALAEAIASLNSGALAPSVTFPNMLWYDTTNSLLKIRNPGNTAWITFATISGSTLTLDASLLNVPASGNWFGTTNRVPYISTTGILEIGSTIDFHPDAAGTEDYRLRISRATGADGIATITQTGLGGINFVPGTGGILLNGAAVGLIPVGTVAIWFGTAAPSLWILLNGQNISRTTYAALFAVWGTTYGAGNGSTTFTVPDVRGRVIAGQDDMGGTSANRLTAALTGGINGDTLGGVGGDEGHAIAVSQLPSHNHPGSVVSIASGGGFTPQTPVGDDDGNDGLQAASWTSRPVAHYVPGVFDGAHGHPGSTVAVASQGSGAEHNNVQPTIIANIIAFAGV